jgi:hypothetical protein
MATAKQIAESAARLCALKNRHCQKVEVSAYMDANFWVNFLLLLSLRPLCGFSDTRVFAGATPDFNGGPPHARSCARSCELWKCNSGAATYCEGSRAVEIKSPLLVSIEGYSKQEHSAKWISILRSIESRESFTDGMFALRLILS